MFRKVITYFLILAVVLPIFSSAIPLPDSRQVLGVNVAHAEDTIEKTSNNSAVSSPCDFNPIASVAKGVVNFVSESTVDVPVFRNPGGSVWDCASYTVVYILYEFVMKISIWIAGLASDLFNISIQFSLTGEVFDADKNIMINDGWTLVRDLLNLVFIFILLFAAISTILQYGGVDIKKILPGLIIAALLVNFSMMISKMVIDASHIFAWEFYNQIDETNKEKLGNKEIFTNMQGSINVDRDFKKKNLANVFIAGFNPQKMLIESEMATITEENGEEKFVRSPWGEVYEHARKTENDESITSTLWRMALIILLETVLALFAAFILLAGAIMFVARVVILWLVMIFSPIAFLGMILPSMGKYSKMWWHYLMGQSFFAPAFLFMFMLATKFINSKLIDNLLRVTPNDDSKIVAGLSLGEIVLIFFNFFVVGMIMMACLIVARQLGGKTAEFGISWAHKGKDLALGAANKIGWRPTRYGLRYGGGATADAILEGKGKFASFVKKIPFAPYGLQKLGAMKKADEKAVEKKAEKYASGLSDAGYEYMEKQKREEGLVSRFVYGGGVFPSVKAGYENIIRKKQKKEVRDKKEKSEYKLVVQNLVEQAGIEIKKEDIEEILKNNNYILDEKMERKINEGIQKNIDENKKKLIGVTIEIKKLEAYMTKNPSSRAIQEDLRKKVDEKEKINDVLNDVKQNRERKNQLDQNRISREQTETLETAVKSTGGDKEKSEDKSKSK